MAASSVKKAKSRLRGVDYEAEPLCRLTLHKCNKLRPLQIRLRVIKITALLHHNVRHGGKRLLLRCTRSAEVQAADRAGNWPAGR
jgi:hypothetical protein